MADSYRVVYKLSENGDEFHSDLFFSKDKAYDFIRSLEIDDVSYWKLICCNSKGKKLSE